MIGNKFRNIAGAGTTTVKSGRGVLRGITVDKAVLSGVITIYDSLSAAGTKIATITHPGTLLQNQYDLNYFNAEFGTGLTVVTSAADDITLIYE
jgi:hypothetical protein